MSPSTTTARGVVASLCASVFFGALYFTPPQLLPLGAFEIVAWRVLVTLPLVLLLLRLIGEWPAVISILRRIKRRPALVLVFLLNAALLAPQFYLFAWAPQTGHGLEVALGYFLMPLMMVFVGVFLFRERMGVLRTLAVASAVMGVIAAFLVAGGLHWSTVVVAVGYPIYFAVRKAAGLNSSAAFWLELWVMLPVVLVVALNPVTMGKVIATPSLWFWIPILGFISAVALVAYTLASRILPISLFGMLGYVEPLLLVLVSLVLLGEGIEPAEYFTYGGILTAVVLLTLEGWFALRANRRGTVPERIP